MKRVRDSLVLALALLVWLAPPAFAQAAAGATISGTVVDRDGGIIPGATVVVTNDAGTKFQAVTNNEGVFAVPALSAGTYKVSVSLSGFKTWTSEVRLAPNTQFAVKAVLEVGTVSETVTVTSGAELVNTQTPTITSTLNTDALNRMPTATRNALNAVTFLPGVNTGGTNRNSTINGLPQSMINITLDGVSNNDNFNKSTDGFFASITPRQDAIEAVTVTTAVQGVSSGGGGGVTISFQTRSGTNRYSGSAYDYYRNPKLNTNYWFNIRNSLPKNDVKVYQYGVRFGGPIRIPGLYDGHNKAFFFTHYEQLRFPNSFTRFRTVYVPDALDGWFYYNVGATVQRVNVLDVARANGQITAKDPLMLSLLGKIAGSTQTTGAVNTTSNPLLNEFVWQSPGRLFEHQPTLRIDYNITSKHRLSGSAQTIMAERSPDYLNGADARFPGAPNSRLFTSVRPLYSMTLRSVLSPSVVNQLVGGLTAIGGQGSRFGYPTDPNQGPGSFADQNGLAINFPLVTNWWVVNTPSWRAAPTYNIDESLTWQKGLHALNIGGSFLRSSSWESAQQIVPQINFGVDTTNDPANAMFNGTNFPGASSTNLNDARAHYATLTGRISQITGQAALNPATNQYVAFGPRKREGYIDVWSAYGQDNWRATSTMTISAGVRWDVQLPFTTSNDTMSTSTLGSACGISGVGDGATYSKCNFFHPGTNANAVTEFIRYSSGTKGYNTDWNNVGPSLGVAWRPNAKSGFMRTILGDPEQATLRGGYSETFERQGIGVLTGTWGSNPGSTLSLTRNASIGNLVLQGEPWPILLSETNRLYQASFPTTPTFPIAPRAGRADNINIFAPDTVIASSRSWTLSFQRSISRDMAVDFRYVGTKGVNRWDTLDYNERDILGNKFFDEFQLGMKNLAANNAAGGTRAGSFAYFGPGTGTYALPTYLAYINGRTNATDAAAYTGSNWTSSTLAQRFVAVNSNPFASASDLDGSATLRANALAAGIPSNFFVLNPAVGSVNITDSGGFSTYHALQIDVRRRLSHGLSADVNYQYAREFASSFLGFRYGRVNNPQGGANTLRHAIKTDWDWTMPFGRGQHYGTDMPRWLDAFAGGWSFNGVGRVQQRMVNFGNVNLVGMTATDLQKMYKHEIRVDPATGKKNVYMLPDDVILNTRRAWNVSTTSVSGYGALGAPEGRYIAPPNSASCIQLKSGDCAPRTVIIRAPWFSKFDVGIAKRFALQGTSNIEFRFDMLNVFNTINFDAFSPSTTTTNAAYFGATTFSQVTGAYQDPNNSFDPGGRLGQLMIRVNW